MHYNAFHNVNMTFVKIVVSVSFLLNLTVLSYLVTIAVCSAYYMG